MSLRQKTVTAFFWVGSVRLAGQIFSWIVTALMARLLLPSDFGLLGMAWLIVTFLDLLNELGIGAAIIQKQHTREDELSTIYWFSLLLSLLLYVVILILAPLAAAFFHDEQLTPILRVMAIILVIGSMQVVPLNLLTKELAFFRRSMAELSSILAGGLLSVVLVMLGWGVWSLVISAVVRHFVLSLIVTIICPWRPKLIFSPWRVIPLLRFGLTVASSRILIYIYTNSDSFVVGKLLGQSFLGFYSLALDLSNALTCRITAIVNTIVYPIFSIFQNDSTGLKNVFYKLTRSVALITFPAMTGMLLVSEDLVVIILTDKWHPMIAPLRALCIVAALKSIDQVLPMLLYARNRPNVVFRYTMACAILLPIAFLLGSRAGLSGIAWSYAIAYPLASTILFKHGLKEICVSPREYIVNLMPPLSGSVIMALAVGSFRHVYDSLIAYDAVYRLLASVLIGICSYILYIALCDRGVISEFTVLYRTIRAQNNSGHA